jgi:hypothetical protein
MTPADMAQLPPLPPPIARPKWARFLWDRALSPDEVAPVLNRSREYVRQLGLPIGHPKRGVPTDEEVAFIAAWTRGEVGEADWPPLSQPQAADQ